MRSIVGIVKESKNPAKMAYNYYKLKIVLMSSSINAHKCTYLLSRLVQK